jgi:hypothetical protein
MIVETLPGATIAIVELREGNEKNLMPFCSIVPKSGRIEIPDEFFTVATRLRIRHKDYCPCELNGSDLQGGHCGKITVPMYKWSHDVVSKPKVESNKAENLLEQLIDRMLERIKERGSL